jgi:hypothetical protein
MQLGGIQLNELQLEAVKKALGGDREVVREAEKLAGVAHVPAQAAYGLRRQTVDGTDELRVSDRAQQIAEGWKDVQTMKTIYADPQPRWAIKRRPPRPCGAPGWAARSSD